MGRAGPELLVRVSDTCNLNEELVMILVGRHVVLKNRRLLFCIVVDMHDYRIIGEGIETD